MNLLQEISVTGTIHPTHARLSLQFCFRNPTSQHLSPTYLFPLPESATITGMQLLTREKKLLRAKIASMTDPDLEEKGFRLVQLDPQLYSLTWECLPAGDTCTVLIECLVHLLPENGRYRLILPFGLPFGNQGSSSPCPANLDLVLKGLEPLRLSPQDSYIPDTNTLSCTARTDTDFVLDLTASHHTTTCGYLQEKFGKGCGFARLQFPTEPLLNQSGNPSVRLLLDLSHATTLRVGNTLKELFFRFFSAIPKDVPIQCMTTSGPLPEEVSSDELYQYLQSVPTCTGSLDALLQFSCQTPDCLTILVSDGGYLPSVFPDFPIVLATVGSVRQTILSHQLHGEHLHFYPDDHPEKTLSSQVERLLSPKQTVEIVPKGGTFHDCILFSSPTTLTEGYLDVAFSYSGHPPAGISLWQGKKEILSCPLTNLETYPQFPDAHQLFALAKCQRLTDLLKKASPVSKRGIKKELATLQTDAGILGSETSFVLPVEETYSGIPTLFYSPANGLESLSDRPTVFGEGVRTLPLAEREQLADRCRKTIYSSIRSDGSIHSPFGITPQVSAEETTFSYLALYKDGKTDSSILEDALSYLNSAPETPWSFLIKQDISGESLQKLISSLPPFETLLDSLGNSLPLMTANYLLLWLSLM